MGRSMVPLWCQVFLLSDVNALPALTAFLFLLLLAIWGLVLGFLILIFGWQLLGRPVVVPIQNEGSNP
jgi:apolipoprotein N-acyltransferase